MKKANKKKSYTHQDKFDMVEQLLKRPEKAKMIAKKYNVGVSTLYKWRSRFLEGARQELENYKTGPKATVAHASEKSGLKKKVADYEKRIAELVCENEILKKNENWISGPLL
ncbi:MAG: transposase [Simkaniaceae bacterium]|nr:transposase [Flavobacteriaceae bacterium]NRA90958.1 transposase [Simkaniaceae bacterium]